MDRILKLWLEAKRQQDMAYVHVLGLCQKLAVLKFVHIGPMGTSPTTLNKLSGDEDFRAHNPVCRAGLKGEWWGKRTEHRTTMMTRGETLKPV